jgi:hypothetical protein
VTSKGKEWTPELEVLKLGHCPFWGELRSNLRCAAVRPLWYAEPDANQTASLGLESFLLLSLTDDY